MDIEKVAKRLYNVLFPSYIREIDPVFYKQFVKMLSAIYIKEREFIQTTNKLNDNVLVEMLPIALQELDHIDRFIVLDKDVNKEILLKLYTFYGWIYHHRGNIKYLYKFFELLKLELVKIKYGVLKREQDIENNDIWVKQFVSYDELLNYIKEDLSRSADEKLYKTISEIHVYITESLLTQNTTALLQRSFEYAYAIDIYNLVLKFLPYHVVLSLILVIETLLYIYELEYIYTETNLYSMQEYSLSIDFSQGVPKIPYYYDIVFEPYIKTKKHKV